MIYYHIIYQISVVQVRFSIWVSSLQTVLGQRQWSVHWLQAIFDLLHFNITHLPYEPPSKVMREQTVHFPVWTAGFLIHKPETQILITYMS